LADLIDPDRAIREAARLAYSDIGELFDEQNKLLPLKSWPAHIRAAVASVKNRKFNAESGDGKQDDIVELKLWDKPKNIELLFKHLGLLEDRIRADMKLAIVHELGSKAS
jgi:phage terminase small subunit